MTGHSNWVRTADFNIDATKAVTGSDDKQVKLWDVVSHQALYSFHDHTDAVNNVTFLNDGRCIASCSADKSIKMWDVRSAQLIQHYQAHEGAVNSISIHPSGNYILSSSNDSTLKIWDIREGRLIYTLQGHSGSVNAASFSEDGHFFASGGSDKLVMVWKSNLPGVSSAPKMEWGQGESPRSSTLSGNVSKRSTSASVEEIPVPLTSVPTMRSSLSSSASASLIPRLTPAKAIVSTKPISVFSSGTPTSTAPSSSSAAAAATSAPVATSDFVDRNDVPPAIKNALDHIIQQMDIMTQTLVYLEQRISNNEEKVAHVINSIPKGLLSDESNAINAGEFDDSDDDDYSNNDN